MARHIHIHVEDAGQFNEGDHPRDPTGKFGSGSGGGASAAGKKKPGGTSSTTTKVNTNTKTGQALLGSFLRNENEKAATKKKSGTGGGTASGGGSKTTAAASATPSDSPHVQKLKKWQARYQQLVKEEKDPKKKAEYQADLKDVEEELRDSTKDSSCGCGG